MVRDKRYFYVSARAGKGELVSFWVSRNSGGASQGYVGAGGPGFTGPIDTVGDAIFAP